MVPAVTTRIKSLLLKQVLLRLTIKRILKKFREDVILFLLGIKKGYDLLRSVSIVYSITRELRDEIVLRAIFSILDKLERVFILFFYRRLEEEDESVELDTYRDCIQLKDLCRGFL